MKSTKQIKRCKVCHLILVGLKSLPFMLSSVLCTLRLMIRSTSCFIVSTTAQKLGTLLKCKAWLNYGLLLGTFFGNVPTLGLYLTWNSCLCLICIPFCSWKKKDGCHVITVVGFHNLCLWLCNHLTFLLLHIVWEEGFSFNGENGIFTSLRLFLVVRKICKESPVMITYHTQQILPSENSFPQNSTSIS